MAQLTDTPVKCSVVGALVDPVPIPDEDIISGKPESAMAILWRSEDAKLYNGVWHCTPGVFMLTHPAETICLVEGRVTITPQNGKPMDLAAGDVAFIPEGTVACWEVHETVRKAFHSYDSSGTLLGGA